MRRFQQSNYSAVLEITAEVLGITVTPKVAHRSSLASGAIPAQKTGKNCKKSAQETHKIQVIHLNTYESSEQT